MNNLLSKQPALRVYLNYCVLSRAFMNLVFTVNMIYFVTQAGLNPLQMVLVGTTLELSIFLFEIPTGVVADTISRKKSIIIGVFFIGAGFILQSLVLSFALILVAQILWGLGYTFTSGALQAWISDEIGEEEAARAFIKATQLEQLGSFIAIGISILTAIVFQLRFPMMLGGICFFLLAFYLLLVMPEDHFHPAANGEWRSWSSLAATLKNGIGMLKIRPVLLKILLVGFFFGLYSEGLDRLWVPQLIERFHLPDQGESLLIGWIGGLQAASLLVTFFAAGWIHRYFQKQRMTSHIIRLLTLCSIFLVISVAAFAIANRIWLAFLVLILISMLRELIYPLYTAWVNHRLESETRATVLSFSSLVDAFGQIGGGPIVGVIATNASIQSGLLFSSVLLSPVILLLFSSAVQKDSDD